MNRFDNSLKRRSSSSWQEKKPVVPNTNTTTTRLFGASTSPPFPGLADDDLLATVIPPVTVVLEGRSICQRISLDKHASYQSLAKALRQMFVDGGDVAGIPEHDLDLSNAIPGHLIAYEDMDNDLLLAGDLNWKYVLNGRN